MVINIVLSIISGVLLSLAFPKYDLFWLAWIALVPFFVALGRVDNWRKALLCGLSFGLVFFGIHLLWMFTLYRFVAWWIALGWASLVVFQTLFILLFTVLAYAFFVSGLPRKKHFRSPDRPASSALVGRGHSSSGLSNGLRGIAYAIGLALLWVAIEWLRAWGPFGVPGGGVGYSQVKWLAVIQIAAFVTVYGITFLVVFFNISLAIFLQNKERWQTLVISLILILASTFYGIQVLATPFSFRTRTFSLSDVLHKTAITKQLALIQPNIDQLEKLNRSNTSEIFNKMLKLTRQAMQSDPDVVIWPETSVVTYMLFDANMMAQLKSLAAQSDAWLIIGTPHYSGGKASNSMVSISPAGKIVTRYDKGHLVPFSEYLPFRPILYPLLKQVGYFEYDYFGNNNPVQLEAAGFNIAAAICFESLFPDVIRDRVKKYSNFILLLTNDGWFGDSSALYFHLNAGVFRAIENRCYFVQVANTGFSAVIDPYGRMIKKSKVGEEQILTFQMPLP